MYFFIIPHYIFLLLHYLFKPNSSFDSIQYLALCHLLKVKIRSHTFLYHILIVYNVFIILNSFLFICFNSLHQSFTLLHLMGNTLGQYHSVSRIHPLSHTFFIIPLHNYFPPVISSSLLIFLESFQSFSNSLVSEFMSTHFPASIQTHIYIYI